MNTPTDCEKFRTEVKPWMPAAMKKPSNSTKHLNPLPFGEDSAQTELDIAYAYFKNNDPTRQLLRRPLH